VTAGSIIASIFVSGAGFVLFSYGKKQQRMPHLCAGLVMLIYPYFITDALLMLGVAVMLSALLWVLVYKMGV
jgi:hypothetical protein